MKKIEQEKNRPASNIPYQGVNKPFRTLFIVPGPGITIEQDANGVCYIAAKGGAGVADLEAGDNITLTKTDDGKIIISAVDTATEIAAGQNITIDIDPETGTAVINSITGGATNEHYQGVFDTAEDLIAFDTDPETGDYGMIKQITYSDGGETTWNGQYKYCFYINGQWTVVDQMLTFTDDIELIQQFYSVGGSSPVIFLPKIAKTGSFNDLRDVPIVATPVLTVEGDTLTATCATEGAEIWYTTDGTMPHVNGNKYTGPITVTEATTFRFVGIKNGMINSLEATVGVDYQLQPPTIDLDWHDGTITMANPNQSGTIYYTTDGSTPTNASNAYTGPFVIDEATLFKLVVIDGSNQSSVTEQQYLQAKPVPYFSAGVNMIAGTAFIKFTQSEQGEAHYEMFDGVPTFSSPLSDGTLNFPFYDTQNPRYYSVRVFAPGNVPSDIKVSMQNGKQKPTTPEINFDPETGLVTISRVGETLSISYTRYLMEVGCTIRYTIDGSTPTADSLVYTEPFQISGNATVKAVLIAYGQYYSDVVTESIELISEPEISLDSDTGFISISGPSGSTIYYTIDGSTPTTESTEYSAPFDVTNRESVTVKAICVSDGFESAVAEVTYPGLLTKWSGTSGGETDYRVGTISRTPRRAMDGASVFYAVRAGGGYPSLADWLPYSGTEIRIPLFDENNPKEFFFRQTKQGYIPGYYGGTRVGYTTPDAPVIDYDEETGMATLSLDGNTSEIPLQTNENVPQIGARIYYTLDGSTPTDQNGTLYKRQAFAVPEGTTEIKAVTVCYSRFASEVVTEEVTPGPSGDYLYFEAAEANSTVGMTSYLPTAPNLEYSTDGETWQEWQHTTADGTHTFDTLTLTNVGDRVYFRGDNPNGLGFRPESEEEPNISNFVLTGAINAGGNVMSLLDTTMTLTEVPPFGFPLLFAILDESLESALLTAPAMDTIVSIGESGCYAMYYGCASLTAAADMPSLTTISEQGCSTMYASDTSIASVADMPQLTTIGNFGCMSMYDGCTSLITAAPMPLVSSIYTGGCLKMYLGCTSLTTAASMPQLTIIGEQGCSLMYGNCTSLTTAASMPLVGSIGNRGCFGMYGECTSLITPVAEMPQLVSIGEYGCYSMFEGSSVTAAVNMPTLSNIGTDGCGRMYQSCTFDMSSDGTTLNFDFPTPPITTTGDVPQTFATAYNVAEWMGNTNGFTNS